MAQQIQLRRGTTDEHANFTGAQGEVTVDTLLKSLVVHDGETLGGFVTVNLDMLIRLLNALCSMQGWKCQDGGLALDFGEMS